MFDLLNVEDIIKQENLLQINDSNINLKADELLKAKNGLYSEFIFGERLSDSWYLRMAYTQLNVYLPKFPIFQILRNSNILKQFKNKIDKYLDLEEMKLVDEKTNSNILSFSELLTKNGWKLFIQALATKGDTKSQQLLKEYLDKYDPDFLITDKVLILPPGFRDFKINDNNSVAIHELTEAYSKLISYNNQYNKTNDAALKIYQAYENLFNTLIRKFSGKEGVLRNLLASKIVNTATRSVIVPNDNLGLDEIGIPFRALLTMYTAEVIHIIMEKYKTEWLELVSTAKESKLTLSVIDILKVIKKVSKDYDVPDNVKQFFKNILEKDILPNAVVIYKRDPALHKSSFLAAKPKIAQSDAIEINTAVCAPLGGDFDGDSCTGTVNLKVVNKKTGKVDLYRNQDLALFPLMFGN